MTKSIMSLSLLATLLFGASYSEGLGVIASDVKVLNTEAMSSLDKLSQSELALQAYLKKVDIYEEKTTNFTQSLVQGFSSKEEAISTMEELSKLSSQSVVLAKTVAYLSSHQADNANESYQVTLTTSSQTILQLSDDIGVMADRILIMAGEIGVMADRIVTTQEIQTANLETTSKLVAYAMALSSNQITQTRSAMQQTTLTQSSNSIGGQTQQMR